MSRTHYELDYCIVTLLRIVIAVVVITVIVAILSFVVALVHSTCLEFAFVATNCTADTHSPTNKTIQISHICMHVGNEHTYTPLYEYVRREFNKWCILLILSIL